MMSASPFFQFEQLPFYLVTAVCLGVMFRARRSPTVMARYASILGSATIFVILVLALHGPLPWQLRLYVYYQYGLVAYALFSFYFGGFFYRVYKDSLGARAFKPKEIKQMQMGMLVFVFVSAYALGWLVAASMGGNLWAIVVLYTLSLWSAKETLAMTRRFVTRDAGDILYWADVLVNYSSVMVSGFLCFAVFL